MPPLAGGRRCPAFPIHLPSENGRSLSSQKESKKYLQAECQSLAEGAKTDANLRLYTRK